MIERITIQGPAGPLQAVAEAGDDRAVRCGLICHPHPLYGGTMDNKVVTTLARALHDAGIPTLRFNFRGVGDSAGAYDGGTGETADAAAAALWCAARWPGRPLVLAGFSFGAYVALRLALESAPSYLVTVAPPVDGFDFAALAAPGCPWLVVQGDADEVVAARSVIEWAGRFQAGPQLLVMPGVGHFFHGRLQDLRSAVFDAIRSD